MTTPKPKKDTAKHANDKSWKKGQSANPGGRSPRVTSDGKTLTQMCRDRSEELVQRAFEISLSPSTDPKDALSGIFGLLDRGWGKPKEMNEDGSDKPDLATAVQNLIDKLPS